MTRILYVDDDADMAGEVERALSSRGFAVTTALSYEAALATLDAVEVDVVMTDVRMPGPSGIALCQRIASERP